MCCDELFNIVFGAVSLLAPNKHSRHFELATIMSNNNHTCLTPVWATTNAQPHSQHDETKDCNTPTRKSRKQQQPDVQSPTPSVVRANKPGSHTRPRNWTCLWSLKWARNPGMKTEAPDVTILSVTRPRSIFGTAWWASNLCFVFHIIAVRSASPDRYLAIPYAA
jgi:hypothetical protein